MSYLSVVLADAPIHFWRLADPGGFAAFDIGSSSLMLTAGAYLSALPYFGVNSDGGSAFFTNEGQFGNQDEIAWTFPISLEAWIWQVQRANRAQNLITTESSVYTPPSFGLSVDATGHPRVTSNNSALASSTVMSRQAWHHLVGVHTGTTRQLYVDGALAASDSQSFSGANGTITIGARGGDSSSWVDGFVCEAAVYNYALNATKVGAHYAAADQKSLKPTYQAIGNLDQATGTTDLYLSQILAAVQTTFPTTT